MVKKICSLIGGVRLNGKIIGQGAYAMVKEGYKSDGAVCAVKMFHAKLLDTIKGKKYGNSMFKHEASVMTVLNHPNIIQFFGLHYENGSTNNPPWLVMERLLTSLRSFINERCLQPYIKVKILCDVAAGLKYLHSPSLGLVHCDLTPNNILITEDLKAKIGDFGVSEFLQNGKITTQTPGTALYMSPEARQAIASFNEKLDIFSFGWVAIYTFSGVDPDETSYYNRKTQITKLPKLLQKLVEQCLHDEPQERPSASEVFTQLHHITESDMQHTNDVIGSASSVHAVSKANLSGSLHCNHPALVCSDGLSYCNSAPARFVTSGLSRQNELLHNISQVSRAPHNVSLTSSLSASPWMSGSDTDPELAISLHEQHANLDVQSMVRSASTLTELFYGISKHQAIQEISSISDIQCESQSTAIAKVAYISTDTTLCTNSNFEIEVRYKFDDVTASRFCCELKTKISDAINLSELQLSELTIMLHKESRVKIGILHAEPLKNSIKGHSLCPYSNELYEAKLDDYMVQLLWISLLQLYCLLCCFYQPMEKILANSKGSKEGYHQVVEDSGGCKQANTSHGGILTNGSNCEHTTNPSRLILPCVSKQCIPVIHLSRSLTIKVARLSCTNNILSQCACGNIEKIQLTELEYSGFSYHTCNWINRIDHCNDSAGTAAVSCVKAQPLTLVKSGKSPAVSLIPMGLRQYFCCCNEQYHIQMCTIHYTINISTVTYGVYYFLSKCGIQFMSCKAAMITVHLRQSSVCISLNLTEIDQCFGPSMANAISNAQETELGSILLMSSTFILKIDDPLYKVEPTTDRPMECGLHLRTSEANKCCRAKSSQVTMVPYDKYVPMFCLHEMCTSQPNVYLLESLLHKCLRQDCGDQGTSLVSCAADKLPVLVNLFLYWDNRRNLIAEFHISAGDVCMALKLSSTVLFPQLLNTCPFMLYYTWYCNMTVSVARQCKSITTLVAKEVCQKKQVAMYEPVCDVVTRYHTSKVMQRGNTVAILELRSNYLLLGHISTAMHCYMDISDPSMMCMPLVSHVQHKGQGTDYNDASVGKFLSSTEMCKATTNDDQLVPLRHHMQWLSRWILLPTNGPNHISVSTNDLTITNISHYFCYFYRQFHHFRISLADYSLVVIVVRYDAYCLTTSGLYFMSAAATVMKLQLKHTLVTLSWYQVADCNPTQSLDRYTKGLTVITKQGHSRELINATLAQMSSYVTPVIQYKLLIMSERIEISSCKAKSGIKCLKTGLTCIPYINVNNDVQARHHSVSTVVKSQLITTLHCVKQVLGQKQAHQLVFLTNRAAHSQGVRLHNDAIDTHHQGGSSDVRMLTCGTIDLLSAGTSVKVHPYCEKIVGCLVARLNHGTSLHNQELLKTDWSISECISNTLYSNTLSSVTQQLATTSLSTSNNDRLVVTKVSVVYDKTTRCCTAVEGNSLAIAKTDYLRNQVKSNHIPQQVPISILTTLLEKHFYECIITAFISLECSKQLTYQDDCLLGLHGIVLLPTIKIPLQNSGSQYAVNIVVYDPHKNKCQLNKVAVTGNDAILPSGSTLAECAELEPLLVSSKLNTSSVCIGQHFHCLIAEILAFESEAHSHTKQLVTQRDINWHFQYLKPVYFHTLTLNDNLGRPLTIVSDSNLLHKENVKLYSDKLTASRNFPTSRFVYPKLTTRPSIAAGSTLSFETGFSSNVFSAFNSSVPLNAQGYRWHCGMTALLSLSSVTRTLPLVNANPQLAIPWINAYVQTTRRNCKTRSLPVEHLKSEPSYGVVMSPNNAVDVLLMKLDDRNSSLEVTRAPTVNDDVVHKATISINADLVDQLVKSSSSKCLALSYEVGVVHCFTLSHLTSSFKLMVSELYHKTPSVFENKHSMNDALSANMLMTDYTKHPNSSNFYSIAKTCTSPYRAHDLKMNTMKLSWLIVIAHLLPQATSPATQLGHIYCFQGVIRLPVSCLCSGKIIFSNTAMASGSISTKYINSMVLSGSGKMTTFDVNFCSTAVFYKVNVVLACHEFVKNSIQDVNENTNKQYGFVSFVFLVSKNTEQLVIGFTSDLLTFVTFPEIIAAGNDEVSSNAVLSSYKSYSISNALPDNTTAPQQLTIPYSIREQHNIPPIVLPARDIVSQQSLVVSDSSTMVLSQIDALVFNGHDKRVSQLSDVVISKHVVIGTYLSNQFVNTKHLDDKWSSITHHRVYIDLLIDVIQQLVLYFTTLLIDGLVVNTIGQIDVTTMMSLLRHNCAPSKSTEPSVHHSVEYSVYTTIHEQLPGYPVSSKNVNFPMVRAMNTIISSGVFFHALNCVYNDVYSDNHMPGDGLAATSDSHHTTSRRRLQQSTEINGNIVNTLHHCDADGNSPNEVGTIINRGDSTCKVGNIMCIMTQHFLYTPNPFDKQQVCYTIALGNIVFPHVNQYTRIHFKKTTLEFYLIPPNRKLPSDHSVYSLVAAQFISLKDNQNNIGCLLVLRWSAPFKNLTENCYGFTLSINQQRNNHCSDVLTNSFTSIWHKFTLKATHTIATYRGPSNSSFHPLQYSGIYFEKTFSFSKQVTQFISGLIQEPSIEQTLALTTSSREMVISTPPLNLPGNNPASFRGNVSKLNNTGASRYGPPCTNVMLDGFASLSPYTSREWCANTQGLASTMTRSLVFNNGNRCHQSEAMHQQLQLYIQQEMEDPTEKQELLKLNNVSNGYGKQQNNNNGSNNSNQGNGSSNGGGGSGGVSRRGGDRRGGGRGQGTASRSGGGSGNGDEGRDDGGNRRSNNGSLRSDSNGITQDSEDIPPVLQPIVNHTDRQPTIYHPLSLAASNRHNTSHHSEDPNHDSSDFHAATDSAQPQWQHPVEESNVDGRSVLVIAGASLNMSVSNHPLPIEESIPDKGTSKLAITSNLYHPPQHPLPKKLVLPSNHGYNNNIHINTIPTYIFPSENPVPHHGNTHPTLLQAVSENINSIDTTLSAVPIHEVGGQYISVPQISCPGEVIYLKSPKQFYAMMVTGGNTQTVFQKNDIINKSLPESIQAYQKYVNTNHVICGELNLCARMNNEAIARMNDEAIASCTCSCTVEMNSREVEYEQLQLVSLVPEGGEEVLLAPEGGGI